MTALLRFTGATRHEPAIGRWMESRPAELRVIAQRWFAVMRDCGPDVLELMHDGCPCVCVEDAAFAYVNAFRSHVNVGFFQGAGLPDPGGLLQGSGKFMRHVKLRPGQPGSAQALEALIHAAHRDIRARLAAEGSGSGSASSAGNGPTAC